MKILIIKTSSMGDVIHTLPALTDAGKIFPDVRFDWVVEENFAEIPQWHPLVDQVIPVAVRRWRKNPFKAIYSGEWKKFRRQLQQKKYDLIIDAQGLLKSAWLMLFANGERCGLDRRSVWEPLATLFYQRTCAVLPQQHAVIRVRQLFAGLLGYHVPLSAPDYGITTLHVKSLSKRKEKKIVFLHGTTWATKHYPENYWCELAKLISQVGWQIQIPWGNQVEFERAQKIAATAPGSIVLPKMNLQEMAVILRSADAVIAVDTGLGHLAAALSVPTLSLYGATDPVLTGAVGSNQFHFAAQFSCAPCLKPKCAYSGERKVNPPCFETLPPEWVWQKLQQIIL